MKIELAIRAITPPLSAALLKSKIVSSILTKLFSRPMNKTPPSSPAEFSLN